MALDRKRVRGELATFLRQYGRTSDRRGMDPNDRGYDRALERKIKRMPPEELDRLIRDEDDDPDTEG